MIPRSACPHLFRGALFSLLRSRPPRARGIVTATCPQPRPWRNFRPGNYAKAATHLEALVPAQSDATDRANFLHIGSPYLMRAITQSNRRLKNYQAKFPKGHTRGGHLRHRPVEFAQQEFHRGAATQMAALENDRQLREQALLFEGEAPKPQARSTDAIWTLEKLAGPRNSHPRRNARRDGAGQALRRERRRRQSASS